MTSMTPMTPKTVIRYLGGPTALLEYGTTRLLTDPTFDGPGDYPIGNRALVKTAGPALTAAEVGDVDAVLLSHDQHPDNLDASGRTYALGAPVVLSTGSARERLGGPVRTLGNWESFELSGHGEGHGAGHGDGHGEGRREGGSGGRGGTDSGQGGRAGGRVRVTGVPAQHGPDGSEHLVGEVTGFVLEGDGLPTVYVSGDNASLDVVRRIADRFGAVDVAVLFAGAARTALVGDANLTLSSDDAAEAARILGARQVVPLHFEHWAHFTQGADTLVAAFERAGIGDRLRLLKPGERAEFSL